MCPRTMGRRRSLPARGACVGTLNAPRDLYLHLTYDEENVTFLYIRDSVVGQVQATSMDFGAMVSTQYKFT